MRSTEQIFKKSSRLNLRKASSSSGLSGSASSPFSSEDVSSDTSSSEKRIPTSARNNPEAQAIFRKSSQTFYNCARFFPPAIAEDIFKLYSFLRIVDDCVDNSPSRAKDLYDFMVMCQEGNTKNEVVANFLFVANKYHFDPAWFEAFFESMEADLQPKTFQTIDESLKYTYGSAEVVGLMMSKIMNVPDIAWPYAQAQGKAFQWINFIRDIKEDNQLGRLYFPLEDLKRHGLKDLSEQTALNNTLNFTNFMNFQLARYSLWQSKAEQGYQFIADNYLLPIKVAAEMYKYTAATIESNPFIVFERKVRPTKAQIISKFKTIPKPIKQLVPA